MVKQWALCVVLMCCSSGIALAALGLANNAQAGLKGCYHKCKNRCGNDYDLCFNTCLSHCVGF